MVLNKDNANPSMNLQAFRFMFSPSSGIMSIHFVVLHPFSPQEQKKVQTNSAFVAITTQETIAGLTELTTIPMQVQEGPIPIGEVDT